MAYSLQYTGSDPGKLPNCWLNCPKMAETLIMSKFLTFKTPLSEKFDSKVPEEQRFHPKQVFMEKRQEFYGKIGLWIDLTNTSRYYGKRQIEKKDCQYEKMSCQGFGVAPSRDQTRCFINLVDRFIRIHPYDIIAVHCTHGFNRTGYLIASYLIERLNFSVRTALEIFATCRPPGIYKYEYIQNLFGRYGEIVPPDTTTVPYWCVLEEVPISSIPKQLAVRDGWSEKYIDTPDEVPMTKKEKKQAKKEKREAKKERKQAKRAKKILEYEDGKLKQNLQKLTGALAKNISGVFKVTDEMQLNALRQQIRELCELKNDGYLGAQAVPLTTEKIKLLLNRPFHVTWMTYGVQYLMYIKNQNEIYLIDRNNDYFQVRNLYFPRKNNSTVHITNTLLDGQMILENVDGKTRRKFVVYDIIKYENQHLASLPFYPNRLEHIKNFIIMPRHQAMTLGLIDVRIEPFNVVNKEFWNIRDTKALFDPRFASWLGHDLTGLIFQPSADRYRFGNSRRLFKWKPTNQLSFDFHFKIQIKTEAGSEVEKSLGLLYVNKNEVLFAKMQMTEELKEMNERLIECNSENSQWVFLRERTDKSHPDSTNRAKSIYKSIQKPLPKEHLLDFIDKNLSDNLISYSSESSETSDAST